MASISSLGLLSSRGVISKTDVLVFRLLATQGGLHKLGDLVAIAI